MLLRFCGSQIFMLGKWILHAYYIEKLSRAKSTFFDMQSNFVVLPVRTNIGLLIDAQ